MAIAPNGYKTREGNGKNKKVSYSWVPKRKIMKGLYWETISDYVSQIKPPDEFLTTDL